ncbi:MAG: arabinosyltransferase, partial [Actinomycetota bacterium]|nr:arabinosyltransferase [Actinomycetota bacterium]
VERAVATRRVAPLALGLLVAAFTVAATPTGFLAVAPFLVAGRPIMALVRRHAEVSRWPSVLAPVLGAGLLVLAVVFADQTLEGVLEATRIRTSLGPNLSWYEEPLRYQALFTPSADGSLVRRFPVLVFLLCLGTCLAVALRRGGIPGAGLGASRRLIGTAAVSLALIALTPTKWTHHFGSFASIAAALGALTALATSATVLRSARNRWWFLSGLLVVFALAATGPNAPWYVSSFGVPWFDKPPSLQGYKASTALIVMALVAGIVAAVLNARQPPGPPPPPDPPEKRRRALRIGSAPLTLICGILVVAEILAMAKAMHKQRDSYSLGAADVAHITGSSCNLSDAVLIERDRAEGALVPAGSVEADDIPLRQGFIRDNLPASGAGSEDGSGGASASQSSIEGDRGSAASGAQDNPVENPPQGLGSDRIPIWSSYAGDVNTGRIRTAWYELPERALDGDAPVVVSVAGTLGPATLITVQLGRRTGEGIEVVERVPAAGEATDEEPGWRDYRIDVSAVRADTVRFVASDSDITAEGWLAFAAPRVPQLTRMTDVIGAQTPVFMDWPVGFVHPCLRPFSIENGIVELPEYRLLPGDDLLGGSELWSDGEGGGPFGWYGIVATERELPSYLVGAWGVDWGELAVVEPRVADTRPATVTTGTEVRGGRWTPGPLKSTQDAPELSTTIR